MTKPAMRAINTQLGFTLLETIIYIALFSLIFTGLFVSVYPILTGAERLTKNVAAEGETAFILSKLNFALNDTITSNAGVVTIPAEGATANELQLTSDGTEKYRFTMDTSGIFCAAPLVCQQILLAKDSGTPLPLNSSRVGITDFSVKHVAPAGGTPRYLDVSFKANDATTKVRYYLHF